MSKKVLIIGLDGGTWKIFDDLIDKGYMPNLKALKGSGTSGILESTKPPITPAAWTSFMTGTNPGKHGIFDFIRFDREKIEFSVVNSNFIGCETFLEYLSDCGKRVISIQLPMTYPPKAVNGIVVSCFLTPSIRSEFTFPKKIKDEILIKMPNFTISPETIFYKYKPFNKGFEQFLNTMSEQIQEKKNLDLHLLGKYPWDIAFVQFQSLDIVQHALWPYLDNSHKLFDMEKFIQIADRYYRKLDNDINEIIRDMRNLYKNDDVLVVLMSDHGFQAAKRSFNLQRWLSENSYLYKNTNKNIKEKLIEALVRIDKHKLRRWIPFLRKMKERKKGLFSDYVKSQIDFLRSKALCLPVIGWGNIFILGDGNEGIVKNKLIDELEKIYDPATNKPLIKRVYKKEEIYSGHSSAFMPDLILEPTNGYVFNSSSNSFSELLFRDIDKDTDKFLGTHDLDGIFVFNGKDISVQKGLRLHLQDIIPTVLYYMGLSIPENMDGKAYTKMFKEEFPKNMPALFKKDIRPVPTSVDNLMAEEEKDIADRLRSLGYM